nr:hypothetical protein Iba_chr14fCG7240 [Ipomoea batatas]
MRSLTGPSAVILAARERYISSPLVGGFIGIHYRFFRYGFRVLLHPSSGYVALLKDIEAVSSKCWPRLKTINRASLLPEGAATTGNDDSENSSEDAPVQISSSSSDFQDSVAPLVIGASPTASITASPGHPPHRQIAGSKRPSKLNPVSAFKKIKWGLEATSNNGMAHAELRNKLKPLVAGSESLKSVKASHANELNEVGLKVTKLEVAMEEERKMPSV